jgi:hypothetical protein
MSAHDRLLRARGRRGGRRPTLEQPREEEPKPTRGLVTQGARGQGKPWIPQRTVDDAIRAARSDRSVWTRIF